ncbi:MAG: tRNA adenylyl-/cytidylyl-transferase [Candidatus Roizmanbacteria bacterium GW2011_GWC2_41_7]|uniref:tRNA adenylyl-/cytidylyl-transferase n=1 Tax=Candidatus Roizmanbacteria bacterium GW2011_GWC2_41_7 TaxID=1618487 RepID=A0A0G1AAY6_9BACT|nr:MAG: tRNA adenylyl-/cytidylyl-transferase [Candidatus Roizmanbacteria bacterium GW2011_GWC2_41_7]
MSHPIMSYPKLPELPQQFLTKLHDAGYEAYAVGGCIRDLLMDRNTHDWDFTTNATPLEIQKLFSDSFYNNEFGTVGVPVLIQDHEEIYEITTYRTEEGYSDRRRPDIVSWGKTVAEDLARRDFTVNAIAYDGKKIVDPRAVGDPETRFEEDALRLMRAIRIATQLRFTIEPFTAESIRDNARLIHHIASERIRDELFKILKSEYAADGILLLKNHNLLYEIIPEFEKAFATEQKSPERHHIYDVGTHLIESLRNCQSTDVITRFATLLHDIGKPETYEKNDRGVITFYNHEINSTTIAHDIAKRLKLSKKDAGKLVRLVRWHQFTVDERQTDKAHRRFVRRVGKEYIDDMLDLRVADRLGGGARETSWRLELFKKRIEEVQQQPFAITDLKINGTDVMKELNLKPGPEVGKILKQLFKDVEEKRIENEREALLNSLKRFKH